MRTYVEFNITYGLRITHECASTVGYTLHIVRVYNQVNNVNEQIKLKKQKQTNKTTYTNGIRMLVYRCNMFWRDRCRSHWPHSNSLSITPADPQSGTRVKHTRWQSEQMLSGGVSGGANTSVKTVVKTWAKTWVNTWWKIVPFSIHFCGRKTGQQIPPKSIRYSPVSFLKNPPPKNRPTPHPKTPPPNPSTQQKKATTKSTKSVCGSRRRDKYVTQLKSLHT